jgi:predicted nucleic acid-binding protein
VPTPADVALNSVDQLVGRPGCRLLRPGDRNFEIFRDLYQATGATGALIADLQRAALAIEHGCEWVTNDADFARRNERHPLTSDQC